MSQRDIKVWDPLVRFFHWSLVLAFAIAFITEDDWMNLHATAGYYITGLLTFRLVWGFIGTRHARFKDFVFAPREVMAYLASLVRGGSRHYVGHNPAGGAMIVALLVALTLTTVSGLLLYGAGEHAGPLARLFSARGSFWEDPLEEIHEFFANATLLLVGIHVAGVIFESIRHRENLVRAMWTGRKRVLQQEITK